MTLVDPGKVLRSAEGALALPDLARHLHGRADGRLRRLGRLVPGEVVRPALDEDGALACTGVDTALLDGELHRLAHALVAAYHASALPVAAPLERDEHATAALVGYVAAVPLWSATLAALAEVDATFVVLGCDDFDRWDEAVATPLEAWTLHGQPRPADPSLHQLAHALLVANHAALRTQLATSAGAARSSALDAWAQAQALGLDAPPVAVAQALAEVDDLDARPDAAALAATFAALRALRAAVAARRATLLALGDALDRASGAAPLHRVALALAWRPLWALALLRAVDHWLTALTVARRPHPSCAQVRVEAERVAAVRAATERNFARITSAVTSLLGMDP